MSRTFVLAHDTARKNAAQFAMNAPHGYVVKFRQPNKSRDQECHYHAIIGEIAKQFEFCGRKWDPEDMKRLLVHQFRLDTKNDQDLRDAWQQMGQVEMAPSLDGSGVVMLGIQTRRFPKKLAAAFITWLQVFAAENNIKLIGDA